MTDAISVSCKRCGRQLKTLKSIKRGYGPVCAQLEGKSDNQDEGNNASQYDVVATSVDAVVIKDVGVHCKSVTNDAENVVSRLAHMLAGRRLYYFDTMGNLDEILIKNGQFNGFAPGPDRLGGGIF